MGPVALVTIPIVPEEAYNPEFNETVELTLHPSNPSDKLWVTAVYASGRWIGSYGEGSYGLGSPASGSVTIAEPCSCDLPGATSTETVSPSSSEATDPTVVRWTYPKERTEKAGTSVRVREGSWNTQTVPLMSLYLAA